MRAEIVAIGDELTSGQRLDTNSQWLSQRLAESGIPTLYHTTVGDDLAACAAVFREAFRRAEVIVTTGGLGPTADDLTRQALAQATHTELVLDQGVLEHIKRLFARRGREMPERNVVQAMFPAGSRVIPNPHGTAPGIEMGVPRAERGPAHLFALPGVPAEMREMWTSTVEPALSGLAAGERRVIRHRRIHCFGAGESDIEKMLPDLIRRGRVPRVGITASQTTITLRITAEGPTAAACDASMEPTAATIRQCLGNLVFGEEDDRLQDVVVRELAARGRTLATFECDSAGTLAQWLSEADVRRRVVRGSLVVPNRRAVASAVGLEDQEDLLAPPRCAADVQTLARRCRALFGSDYALALGPFPPLASRSGPPPEVHIALWGPAGVSATTTPFAGHPDMLLVRTVKAALNFARLALADRV
jgi:nicotinamide-nucleotide amidase